MKRNQRDKEKKKSWENRKKSLKKVIMKWTPEKCRKRLEVLKRSWAYECNRKLEIALIREHLRSIGKD